jgi:hypothetical protein
MTTSTIHFGIIPPIRGRKKIMRPSWRLLILLLVMVDATWRLFEGTRPIDWIILVVDCLVLLVIAWELYRTEKDRWASRKYQQRLEAQLAKLTDEERDGLKTILNGGQPKLHIKESLAQKIYGLVVRTPSDNRLEIPLEHRSFLTGWLK